MKISGSGTIGAGEYNEGIVISGSAKVTGDIKCASLRASGSVHASGLVECVNSLDFSGSGHFSSIKANNISGSGSFSAEECLVEQKIELSGSEKIEKLLKGSDVQLAGGIQVGNIEADDLKIAGTITCAGMINAGNFVFVLDGPKNSNIGSIGGDNITIQRRGSIKDGKGGFLSNLFTGTKLGIIGNVEIKDYIEGEKIDIDNTIAPRVSGKNVVIRSGCKIGCIQYSESIEIDPAAEVNKVEKI